MVDLRDLETIVSTDSQSDCWPIQNSAYVNSGDSVETAHKKPSHLYLHYLPLYSRILHGTPIFNSGFVHIRSWKSPPHKIRGENVKSW